MGVKLNICLLMLLVATISSQGFNLRKKDDSKDEKPGAPPPTCQRAHGYCTSSQGCVQGFRRCPLPGCPQGYQCCCPTENK